MIKLSEINKGTYVAVNFTDSTLDALQEVQEKLGLLNPVPRQKFHSTICYSRVHIPYIPMHESRLISNTNHLEIFQTDKSPALVLVMDDAEYMKQRHEYTNILGATYDYPDYKPHVTLSYNLGSQYINADTKIDVPLIMESEYVEDLDLNWADELK